VGSEEEWKLRRARRKYRHRDADRVPPGAYPGTGRGETAARTLGNEAPEATGGGTRVLDVISVSCGPVGPFGHDLRYRPRQQRVNALIHEHRADRRMAVHVIRRGVVGLWITLWTSGSEARSAAR
jgi:hypothetical protein